MSAPIDSRTPAIAGGGRGRRFLRFMGSLKLAMILLGVLILACIIGTIAESRFDTAVARAYFYDAPWFAAWLLLLCVNLVGAVLARYPWKPHQAGFILTHAGIVIILAGALAGRIWRLEGTVTLFKGQPPVGHLVLNRPELEVRSSGFPAAQRLALDLETRPPSAARPVRWRENGLEVAVVEFAGALERRATVEPAETGGRPAIRVVLRSSMLPEPVEHWLVLGEAGRNQLALGPLTIQFVDQPSPGNPVEAPGESRVSERHFLFARQPEMSVTRSISGPATGVRGAFHHSGPGSGKLVLRSGGGEFEFEVDQLLGRETELNGTSWRLTGVKYLPDFRLQDREPVTVSDQPNNPALVFDLAGPGSSADSSHHECAHEAGTGDLCQHDAAGSGDHSTCCPTQSGAGTAPPSETRLTFYPAADGRLGYQNISKGLALGDGEAAVGELISPGWSDWTVEVAEWHRSAVVRIERVPAATRARQITGAAGLLVEVKTRGGQTRQWIGLGEPAVLRVGQEEISLAFGYRLHPLPFSIALDRFEVDRDEGTQNPAGFKSHVRFIESRSGQPVEQPREIWMNHPANFPEFPGAGLLGTTYKFSQASWNPDNLDQTTLQVSRDPGWSLKWSGSLLLCFGLVSLVKPFPRSGEIRNPNIETRNNLKKPQIGNKEKPHSQVQGFKARIF